MARTQLKIGSTNVLEVAELQNTVTEDYLDDATITCAIIDETTDQTVTGADNLTVSYVTDTTGANVLYRGTLSYTLSAALVEDRNYTARFTITSGANRRIIDLPCVAGLS